MLTIDHPARATLTSDRLEVTFGENPLVIERILHRPSGRVLSPGGEQQFVVRLPKEPSDPLFLRIVEDVTEGPGSLSFTVRDDASRCAVRVGLDVGDKGIHFRISATGTEPLLMVEWLFEGLALDGVVVPALGGQRLTRDMPTGVQLAYKYPFWWNAQFALGELPNGDGGVCIRTTEAAPRFKLLRVRRVEEREDLFALGLGFEADAPLTEKSITASWTFDGYAGDWQEPVSRHREWLEEVFDLVPYSRHPHFPAWADDINCVLEVWGMRKDRGLPAHTFDETIERIEAFAYLHPPEQTLLYLPGYAQGGIDSRIPEYGPSEELGGAAGLKRLVDAARGMGYRVMIHTNILGMTYTHPRFAEFAEHQVVDQFGQKLGWGNDLDGDWLPEPYFAYIHPGAEAWGDLMEEKLGDLIREFELDAVFLDQTLLAFNVSRGLNFVEGMRNHIRRLQEAFPQVLFAGEGQHEQVLSVLPFVQIHGLDSLTEIHGMEGREPWRCAHPVSTALFGRHARFVAHLLTKHPSSPDFARQEAAYAELGVIPALVLYQQSQGIEGPEVEAMLARARKLAPGQPSLGSAVTA